MEGLSTGEMLRASHDPEVIAVLQSGELVSDELTYEVFDSAIQDAKAKPIQISSSMVFRVPKIRLSGWLSTWIKMIKRSTS